MRSDSGVEVAEDARFPGMHACLRVGLESASGLNAIGFKSTCDGGQGHFDKLYAARISAIGVDPGAGSDPRRVLESCDSHCFAVQIFSGSNRRIRGHDKRVVRRSSLSAQLIGEYDA